MKEVEREPASAFTAEAAKGQQTWCDARADGHSPDERDRVATALTDGGRRCRVRLP